MVTYRELRQKEGEYHLLRISSNIEVTYQFSFLEF